MWGIGTQDRAFCPTCWIPIGLIAERGREVRACTSCHRRFSHWSAADIEGGLSVVDIIKALRQRHPETR